MCIRAHRGEQPALPPARPAAAAGISPAARHRRRFEHVAAHGSGTLTDQELLAAMVGSAAAGAGPHALAERLLSRFGTLAALAHAHPADLTAVAGIGPARAAMLCATFEFARRATVPDPPRTVKSTSDLAAAAWPLLIGRTRERAVVVVCDRAGRVLGTEVLSDGSAATTLMPIREALVAVLRRDGAAFGLVHNHPSGNPAPTNAEITATDKLRQAADNTGLRLLDHVVVANQQWRRVPDHPAPASDPPHPCGKRADPSPSPSPRRPAPCHSRRRRYQASRPGDQHVRPTNRPDRRW